jgi:hypothetical protein
MAKWKTGDGFVFVFVSSLACLLCAGATVQAQSKEASDKAAEIRTLLRERRDLLVKGVAMLTAQYQQGTVDFNTIAQSERDLLRATLDLDEGPEKRTAAIQ